MADSTSMEFPQVVKAEIQSMDHTTVTYDEVPTNLPNATTTCTETILTDTIGNGTLTATDPNNWRGL